MRTIIISSFAVSALMAQSAFAQNLGILNEDNQPKNLIPASEFVNRSTSSNSDGLRSDAYNEGGRGGYGGYNSGYGSGYGNNYGGYGNGYGGGYGNGYGGSYGNGYGYDNSSYYYPSNSYPTYYYSNETVPGSSSSSLDHTQLSGHRADTTIDLSNASVVCFSSDSAGNWFANADVSRNAVSTQEEVNHECLANGANCNQNLGCAVATTDR